MYADTGLLYHPYYQNFSQDAHHLDLLQLCHSQQSHSSMSSTISDYDLGGEGDLFKAPEAIMEEPIVSIDPILDPMTAAISMMSCADHVMPTQELNLGALGSLQNDQLFGEISYECKKNILGSTSTESHLSEVMDIRLPAIASEMQTEEKLITESMFQKSVSSECLSSMDWINANTLKPSFLDFSDLDLGAVYGMRRAFSEGDIKALSNGNVSFIHSSIQQRPPVIGSCTSEDRLQKLSRYRNKKSKRNFGRKIKYACRKALADSQPRIRGRFAKTEETELLKRH